ncbi:hypothetical protein M8J75_010566, partial [Diaphorina citri]
MISLNKVDDTSPDDDTKVNQHSILKYQNLQCSNARTIFRYSYNRCINNFLILNLEHIFGKVSVEMLTGVTKEFQDGFPVFLRKFHAVSAALSPSESFPSLRFLPV